MRRRQPPCIRAAIWEVGKYRSKQNCLSGGREVFFLPPDHRKRQKEADHITISVSFCLFTEEQEDVQMKDVQPIYRTFDELPVMLSIQTVAHVLGISRANAYELAHSSSFPAITIGCRIVVPKDHLLQWIESKLNMDGQRTQR